MTEAFPFLNPLNSIPGIRAAWIERLPGLPITGDRDEAMTLLRPHHERSVKDFAGDGAQWWRAEQIHGTAVAIVPDSPQIIAPDGLPVVPDVDGLITRQPGIVLTIYNADCGAIWLADRKSGTVGLLHSGKKGTEGNILQAALDMMEVNFGTNPADVVAVLSPCIRPPDYEMDIPTEIASQAERAGIGHYLDCGLNTAADLQRFYSYRKEMGKTGRMMALITTDTPQ